MKKSSDYRAQALQTLSGRWKPAVIVSLVYVAIALCFVGVNFAMTSAFNLDKHVGAQLLWTLCYFLAAVFFLSPLGFGFSNAILWYTRHDEEASPLKNLFRLPFASGRYGTFVGVELLLILYVLGFALLLVVFIIIGAIVGVVGNPDIAANAEDSFAILSQFSTGGLIIIAVAYVGYIVAAIWLSLTYSLAPYIVLDQPTLSAYECMTESRKLMFGHKWQLFKLQLSFIGWALLSIFTLCIGVLWLNAYMYTAIAHFYDDMRPKEAIMDTAATEIPA